MLCKSTNSDLLLSTVILLIMYNLILTYYCGFSKTQIIVINFIIDNIKVIWLQ